MYTKKLKTLPEEIIEDEILARLPVKSLLRFRSVSKAWCCLMGSQRFIKTHLQFSAKNIKERGSVVCGDGQLHHLSVDSLLKKTQQPLFKYINVVDGLVCLTTSKPSKEWRIQTVGCCDGLVCIKIGRDLELRLYLWNPATRVSKELPIRKEDMSCCVASGFGWDESSGAYKVCLYGVVFDRDRPDHRWPEVCEVYNSKTNSWKKVDMDNLRRLLEDYCLMTNSRGTVEQEYYGFYGEGNFVSGKVYWRGRNLWKRSIVWFDLKSEVFGVMEGPKTPVSSAMTLGEHEGCLCVVSIDHKKRLDMWVMKEESWLHLVAAVPLVPLVPGYKSRVELPISFVAAPDGQIWLCYDCGMVHVYDLKHRLVLPLKLVQVGDDAYCFSKPHTCIQSLVRP